VGFLPKFDCSNKKTGSTLQQASNSRIQYEERVFAQNLLRQLHTQSIADSTQNKINGTLTDSDDDTRPKSQSPLTKELDSD
jgi:hypothetical protein